MSHLPLTFIDLMVILTIVYIDPFSTYQGADLLLEHITERLFKNDYRLTMSV